MFKPTHHDHGRLTRNLSRHVEKLSPKDITMGAHFDTGGFSDIYRGRWVDVNQTVELAIKVFRKRRDEDPEMVKTMRRRLWAEVETWIKAQPHPNILPFFGVYMDKPSTFPALVSPLRLDGNVLEFLRTSLNANRRLLCAGIANGLAHLHHHKIIHGDLKPQNVLIRKEEDGTPIAEITDFGRAMIQDVKGFAGSLRTTPRYTAPEVLLNSLPSPENSVILPSSEGGNRLLTKYSDVYSLGMVILHVVSGVKPYCHWNESQISLAFFSKDSEEPNIQDHERHCSMEWIWPLLRRCWGFARLPNERSSALECFQALKDLPDPKEAVQSSDMDYDGVTQLFDLAGYNVGRN